MNENQILLLSLLVPFVSFIPGILIYLRGVRDFEDWSWLFRRKDYWRHNDQNL